MQALPVVVFIKESFKMANVDDLFNCFEEPNEEAVVESAPVVIADDAEDTNASLKE